MGWVSRLWWLGWCGERRVSSQSSSASRGANSRDTAARRPRDRVRMLQGAFVNGGSPKGAVRSDERLLM
ncbi:hypothetical protein Pmani_011454 [Petrolisthes manimaculis]|uniref:Uncharacterized protein n=1 Tax=Petrolisthes manimaculis TaxID=1843537 RepID=A0AAE1UB45_9EUCA|nr:hypothetical protein Pmani_011454 [Petrolisthes manimaculis]